MRDSFHQVVLSRREGAMKWKSALDIFLDFKELELLDVPVFVWGRVDIT